MATARFWRIIAVAACIVAAVVWAYIPLSDPHGRHGVTPRTYALAALMIGLFALGVWASLRTWPIVMYFVFAVTFFPCGLYLLGAKGVGILVGLADLAFLLAAVRMHLLRRVVTESRV